MAHAITKARCAPQAHATGPARQAGYRMSGECTARCGDRVMARCDDLETMKKVARVLSSRYGTVTAAGPNGGSDGRYVLATYRYGAFRDRVWRENGNLYHTDIVSMMRHAFMLLDESHRIRMLREVASELQGRGRYDDRADWGRRCMSGMRDAS